MESWLAILIPSLLGIVAGLGGSFLLRRSTKESNETDAFSAVTDQLFKLNDDLREDVDALKTEVATLKEERGTLRQENSTLRGELDQVRTELDSVKEANGSLAAALKNFIAAWPIGFSMPEINYDWRRHLSE